MMQLIVARSGSNRCAGTLVIAEKGTAHSVTLECSKEFLHSGDHSCSLHGKDFSSAHFWPSESGKGD